MPSSPSPWATIPNVQLSLQPCPTQPPAQQTLCSHSFTCSLKYVSLLSYSQLLFLSFSLHLHLSILITRIAHTQTQTLLGILLSPSFYLLLRVCVRLRLYLKTHIFQTVLSISRTMAPRDCLGLNFISFNDLTPRAAFLWASSSIEDCLGYTPEEVIDTSPYDLLVPDDITDTQTAHKENVLNDMVASQVILRYRHKDGSSVPMLVIFSVCHEYLVACLVVLEPDIRPCKFTTVLNSSSLLSELVV